MINGKVWPLFGTQFEKPTVKKKNIYETVTEIWTPDI